MRTPTTLQMQKKGWGFYYYPGAENNPVGEVGYVVDWRADQMKRLEWDVEIDGSPIWTVEIPVPDGSPDGTEPRRISTTRPVLDDDGNPTNETEQDQTEASRELLELVGWSDTNVAAIDVNLFVAGAGDYIKQNNGEWRVISTIEFKRKQTLDDASVVIPFINPHPADANKPIAPVFRVVEVLETLDWLDRQSKTQSKQRVLTSGVAVTADTLSGPNGESFWDVWNETMSARMANPDDLSPVRLQAPVNAEGSVAKLVDWIVPPLGYDQVIDRRIMGAIDRLSYGFPVPPEILKGMQAQSRATAFQVEENAYRAHLEPPALVVAKVARDALLDLLDSKKIKVIPNPSRLLSRQQSNEDVKWAREQGLVTPDYTREVLRIPDDAAPDEAIDGIPIGTTPVPADPANVAADEPVTAAATDDKTLSDLLADIDQQLSSELAGYTVSATERARQRLGSIVRAKHKERVRDSDELRPLNSSELATKLGADGLAALGVDVLEVAAEPIDSAARWWVDRVAQVWSQLGQLVPGWQGQGAWVEESVSRLDKALGEHILTTLSEPLSPLDAGSIRDVLDAAAGGS